MKIVASELEAETAYKLMTGVVVPRPIAWVTTLSPGKRVNLAPFSCFTFVSSAPPMVGINVGRIAGRLKDTGRNIHETGEFVVHIADDSLIEPIHFSAVEHPPSVSEVDLLGLRTIESETIAVPRLAVAPIAMECRLHQAIPFGRTGSEFMVGEIAVFHIRDGLCENYKINTEKLRPTCRLGGPNYARLGEIVPMASIAQTAKVEIVPAPAMDPSR